MCRRLHVRRGLDQRDRGRVSLRAVQPQRLSDVSELFCGVVLHACIGVSNAGGFSLLSGPVQLQRQRDVQVTTLAVDVSCCLFVICLKTCPSGRSDMSVCFSAVTCVGKC